MDEKEKDLNNLRESIRVIEGLFHAVNAASFPLQWHQPAINGMGFIQQIHRSMVDQLPQEEKDKIIPKTKSEPVPMGVA